MRDLEVQAEKEQVQSLRGGTRSGVVGAAKRPVELKCGKHGGAGGGPVRGGSRGAGSSRGSRPG